MRASRKRPPQIGRTMEQLWTARAATLGPEGYQHVPPMEVLTADPANAHPVDQAIMTGNELFGQAEMPDGHRRHSRAFLQATAAVAMRRHM